MLKKTVVAIVALLTFAVIFNLYNSVRANPDFAQNFQAYLDNQTLRTDSETPLFKSDLIAFYEGRDYKPVWFKNNGKPNNTLEDFQEAIQKQAYLNGLEPADYDLKPYAEASDDLSGDALFEREWKTTNAVLHYLNDIRNGRINPEEFDSMIFVPKERITLSALMDEAVKEGNTEGYLAELAPPHHEYQQLKKALAEYREISENGGWKAIDINVGTVINPGEAHEAIPQIRARMNDKYHRKYDGELPRGIWVDKTQFDEEALEEITEETDEKIEKAEKENSDIDPETIYDSDLARRIAEFQYFHGHKADGVIGPDTIKALNISVEDRIDQISLAMERWRWLPDDLGKKHVRVNIAAFYARAVENGKDEFVMPIIVGQVAHQTPVFSSVIENIKVHPDWTSPDSISQRYVIPKIQNNPAVANRLGYQLISADGGVVPWKNVNTAYLDNIDLSGYTFRQKPGVDNALGLARFSIKNDYAIFMHGTPSEDLFNEDDRTYSSGCIRLEDPLKMGKFLLGSEDMSKGEFEKLYKLEPGEHPDTTFVELHEDVPVHITYMTAWVDEKDHIHFAEDVYKRDAKLKGALKRLN